MKKSFIVFSLIGLVVLGMSFSSCSDNKMSEPNYSYEEGWNRFEEATDTLFQEYVYLLGDERTAQVSELGDIELQCKYKGANTGKLFYKLLDRMLSKKFLAEARNMQQDEVKERAMLEMEDMGVMMDEQIKQHIMDLDVNEKQMTKLDEHTFKIYTKYIDYALTMSTEDLRHFTEEYMERVNTILTDKEEKLTLTTQISMMYYTCAFWMGLYNM